MKFVDANSCYAFDFIAPRFGIADDFFVRNIEPEESVASVLGRKIKSRLGIADVENIH
jgi:hypothetical protein